MATTVSVWAKPGGWALDAEENESELLQEHKQDYVNENASGGHDTGDFPSLAAAAVAKTKKKKLQTLSLQEFTTYKPSQPTANKHKGLTPDELLALPTGPRERTAEELDRNKLGGGFKSYGSYNERPSRDEQPRRQGSFNRDSSGEVGLSRADETDNWAAGKKLTVGNGFERRERGGFFSDSQSRAEDSDHWGSNKSFVQSEPRRYERRGGFGLESNNGGADTESWVKRKEEEGRKIGGAFESLRDRRGGIETNGADSEAWGMKKEERSSGIGGRPRLNLQPRTMTVSEGQKGENGVKSKGKNPFGEARPREEVLKEKGQDWKEIEEKLETTKIKEVGTGSPDGQAAGKKSFWNVNGREKLQQEESTWKKSDSVDSHPQSAEETENGSAEETKDRDLQM